jgi:hypothetical protein
MVIPGVVKNGLAEFAQWEKASDEAWAMIDQWEKADQRPSATSTGANCPPQTAVSGEVADRQ